MATPDKRTEKLMRSLATLRQGENGMDEKLQYPLWQQPLLDAIVELNPRDRRTKLQKAEEIITFRMRELPCGQESEHEGRLLHDGISILENLKRSNSGPSGKPHCSAEMSQ
jgi:hypothetical protein